MVVEYATTHCNRIKSHTMTMRTVYTRLTHKLTLIAVARHEARANALDLVRTRLTTREHGRVLGFHSNRAHARLLGLQVL